MIERNSEFGNTANKVFQPGEEVLKTGDYVWRFTYDLLYDETPRRRLPQPEAVGVLLFRLLGLR